jgi:ABC-type transport system substrate-binding protein
MKDILNRTIKVGDIVLTNYYRSSTMGIITKVTKVNKQTVELDFPYTYSTWQLATEGQWVKVKQQRIHIRRYSHQVLVIDAQLDYNKTHYPEDYI